jgi:enolase
MAGWLQGSRTGEAEADLAVGIGAWAIKCGAPSGGTIGKLNRLIAIEEHLANMNQVHLTYMSSRA